MKKIISVIVIMGVCLTSYTQTLNLVMGSTITNERQIFRNPDLSAAPIPFFTVGLAYQHTNNINVSMAYAVDLKIVTFQCQIPFYAFRKKRGNFNFAVLNNSKCN